MKWEYWQYVCMGAKNLIKALLEQQDITPYRFWKDTGLSRSTAYRLCDDSSYIPTGEVIEKICRAYGLQPGDFIIYEPDE